MDANYEPPLMERRTIYGVTLEQRRNDAVIDRKFIADPANIVSDSKEVNLFLSRMSYSISI